MKIFALATHQFGIKNIYIEGTPAILKLHEIYKTIKAMKKAKPNKDAVEKLPVLSNLIDMVLYN